MPRGRNDSRYSHLAPARQLARQVSMGRRAAGSFVVPLDGQNGHVHQNTQLGQLAGRDNADHGFIGHAGRCTGCASRVRVSRVHCAILQNRNGPQARGWLGAVARLHVRGEFVYTWTSLTAAVTVVRSGAGSRFQLGPVPHGNGGIDNTRQSVSMTMRIAILSIPATFTTPAIRKPTAC